MVSRVKYKHYMELEQNNPHIELVKRSIYKVVGIRVPIAPFHITYPLNYTLTEIVDCLNREIWRQKLLYAYKIPEVVIPDGLLERIEREELKTPYIDELPFVEK